MSDYIDLVICKYDDGEKGFLCYAPMFTHLKKNDLVIVEESNRFLARVDSTITVTKGSEEHDFILKAFDGKEVGKIVSIVKYEDLEY